MRFIVIKKCAICDKRIGRWTDKQGISHYEMEVHIDSMLDDNFKSYICCGHCALDRTQKKTLFCFENRTTKKTLKI